MVKNKALPDPARLCCTPQLVTHSLSLSLSLSLPLEDLALSRLVFCVFSLSLSLSRWCHSSRGYPLDPAKAGPRHHSLVPSHTWLPAPSRGLLSSLSVWSCLFHIPGFTFIQWLPDSSVWSWSFWLGSCISSFPLNKQNLFKITWSETAPNSPYSPQPQTLWQTLGPSHLILPAAPRLNY